MKVACVTTTINVPDVLRLYAAADPTVHFFVVGDRKTPDSDVCDMLIDIPEHSYYGVGMQHKLGYKCSELIGYNSIQRRNIGFLEAAKWGADVVVSVDDDNAPISQKYFYSICEKLLWAGNFSGLCVEGASPTWFDPGILLQPPAKQRGIPYAVPSPRMSYTTNAKIGVVAGLCLGDPDVDAATRMVTRPAVGDVSSIGEAGVVVKPGTATIFNSQNTAVLRELIPAWGMVPYTGRMDDIYASVICQRIMRDRDMHVHFGKPLVWQSRNEHNLIKDLRGEIDGYENVVKLFEILRHVILPGKTIIDDCRAIWTALEMAEWMPRESIAAMVAYLDDCEAIGL